MLCAIPVAAQVNTSSPYSRFGLGELNQPGFTQNLSMGGIGIGLRSSSQINFLNPASYTEMDTLSFLFDFGLLGSQTNYTDGTLSSRMMNYNIHHIAMGFSISRNWKASVGIVPYSSVGYNITESKFVSGAGLAEYYYQGSGGLNRLYIGNAFKIYNHFSLGLNLSYIFGYIDYLNSVQFPADASAASTKIENRLNIGDMTYNFGFQYHNTFSDKYLFTAGIIFDNETKLNTTQKILQSTIFPGSAATIGDSILIDPDFKVTSNSYNKQTTLPQHLGGGFSFGIKNKLIISGDYSTTAWSKSFIPGKTDTLSNSNSLNFGVEYTPDYQSLKGYLNKIHYRAGGYYSNSYLHIRGEQLQDYGISFGVGLPFKGSKSSFNLGMTIGQRGTLTNNLIKENYGVVTFGLTLHDFWFFKPKFD